MEIEVCINGMIEHLSGCTVADYISKKKLSVNGLVVELNGQIIREQQWQMIRLVDGDKLELLNFVGGG